jgi:hypothetical protein
MIHDNNNNNNLTLANGVPNLANPRVLAAFIDGMGILLSPLAIRCIDQAKAVRLSATDLANIVMIFRTLNEMRNSTGLDTDWYGEPQHDLIKTIIEDGERKRKAQYDGIAKAMLAAGMPLDMIPPHMRPKSSPAEVAESMLQSLRADDMIG